MNTDNKKSIIGDITPLPWRIVQHSSNNNLQYIFAKNDWIVKEVEADLPQQKANAAYIVLACNLFPELLEALEEAKTIIRQWHGMAMKQEDESKMWEIYERNAPEIKRINTILNKAKK